MFADTNGFRLGHTERTQVCIFGSGPAGMTLAQNLALSGIDVILAEAGGLDYEPESQELYEGEVVGDRYFDLAEARLRMFGGSSGHWGGVCRPMQERTFTPQARNGVSGWPIKYDEISSYEAAAADILEVPGYFSDTDLGSSLYKLDFQMSPPVHFGDKFHDFCDTSSDIRVALETALIDLDSQNGEVTSATVISQGTRPWRIEANYFVLCAGGIENSRLLRWINEKNDRALIANHDLIGRYWMEHLYTISAHGLIFDEGMPFLGNKPAYFGTKQGNKVQKPVGANFEFEHLLANDNTTLPLLKSIMCVAPRLGNALTRSFNRNLVCGSIFSTHSEQLPDPDNRITLSKDRDRLDIPKPVLHWRRTKLDRQIIVDETLQLAEAFANAGIGRALLTKWVMDESLPIKDEWRTAAWHHMGGTRMGSSPDTGIVDKNLKIHDQKNLYVGGSSIFPTGDHVNPTLTIVQFSLRLADHLKGLLGENIQ